MEGGYGGPESIGQKYAIMTHKETACDADGKDIHPTHNPLPNAHTSSPKMSTSQKRIRDVQSVIRGRQNIYSVTRVNLETITRVKMF